jgi:ubiquinone/menaquinone biosynthesis C-methylase UbiE
MSHFEHFDVVAPYYDRLVRPGDPARLKEILGLPMRGGLLDVGGGTGRAANLIKDYVDFIVVADLSIKMLMEARRKDGLITVGSQSERLPFKDGAFARAIMVDAFHHVYDFRATARELWRVIKPGGMVVIEEPDIRKTGVKLMALFEKLALMRSHFVSPPDIAAIFNNLNAQAQVIEDGATAWIVIEKSK